MTTVAILHPGRMGAAVAAQAATAGARVRWCPAGRSEDTAERAAQAGLEPADDLGALLKVTDVVLSLCPPAVAEEVAEQVAAHNFTGLFVEANAISPQRAGRIAQRLEAGGAHVVDGCVFGSPPGPESSVRLYLAGAGADIEQIAGLFTGTQVSPVPMEGEIGKASAIKSAQSSYQKASRALAAVAYALAEHHGVRDELHAESQHFAQSALTMPDYLPTVAARAWRWGPEMAEVGETLAEAGLPDDFARAAAEVFSHWIDLKDEFGSDLSCVLSMLRA